MYRFDEDGRGPDGESLAVPQRQDMCHAPDARRGAGTEAVSAPEFMPDGGVDVDVQHVIDTTGRLDTGVATDAEGFEQGAVEEGHSRAPDALSATVGRMRRRQALRWSERAAPSGRRRAVLQRRGLQATTDPEVNPVGAIGGLGDQLTGQPDLNFVLPQPEAPKAAEREQVTPDAALAGNGMHGDATEDEFSTGWCPRAERDPSPLPAMDHDPGPFPEPEAAPDLARHDLHAASLPDSPRLVASHYESSKALSSNVVNGNILFSLQTILGRVGSSP